MSVIQFHSLISIVILQISTVMDRVVFQKIEERDFFIICVKLVFALLFLSVCHLYISRTKSFLPPPPMFDFVTHHKTPLELLLSVLRKWKNSTISPQFRTAFWKLGLQTAGMWINSGTIDKKKN